MQLSSTPLGSKNKYLPLIGEHMKNVIVLALTLIISSNVLSQDNDHNPPYVIVLGGLHSPSYEQFDNIGNQKNSFSPQVIVGLPLNHKLSLQVRYSYYSKSNFTSTYQNGPSNNVIFINSGSANYIQQYLNIGLSYSYDIVEHSRIYFNIGLANSRIRLNQTSQTGRPGEFSKGLIGFYGGLSFEQQFPQLPISLYLDSEYSSISDTKIFPKGEFGGVGFTGGIKYCVLL